MKVLRIIEIVMIVLGCLCIIAGLCVWGYNVWDDNRAKANAAQVTAKLEAILNRSGRPEEVFLDENAQPLFRTYPNLDMPVAELEGETFVGILDIPALGLELPVYNDWSYELMRSAPCRYSGTAYAKNLVIAAHNYRSHFGRIEALKQGDPVRFTDMTGHVFEYEVGALEILAADDVQQMVNSPWELTLFTCTVGGQSRTTVRCRLRSGKEG